MAPDKKETTTVVTKEKTTASDAADAPWHNYEATQNWGETSWSQNQEGQCWSQTQNQEGQFWSQTAASSTGSSGWQWGWQDQSEARGGWQKPPWRNQRKDYSGFKQNVPPRGPADLE